MKQLIICLFKSHKWEITWDNINGETTKRCSRCNKKEFIYNGDWYPIPKKYNL